MRLTRRKKQILRPALIVALTILSCKSVAQNYLPPADGSYLHLDKEGNQYYFEGKITILDSRHDNSNIDVGLVCELILSEKIKKLYPITSGCISDVYRSKNGKIFYAVRYDDIISGEGYRIGIDGNGTDILYTPKYAFSAGGCPRLSGRFIVEDIGDDKGNIYPIIISFYVPYDHNGERRFYIDKSYRKSC